MLGHHAACFRRIGGFGGERFDGFGARDALLTRSVSLSLIALVLGTMRDP